MSIHLHNTLSGKKDLFKPLQPGAVKMYTCGPTVYSEQHIGNMRAMIFSDTLARVLAYNGYKVSRVTNITDVGHLTGDNEGDADVGADRMEKAAAKEGKEVQDIAKEVTELFLQDLVELNIDTSDILFPRATEYIQEQIIFIQTLEEKGYTYVTNDGVYFDTSLYREYGKLGNIDVNALKEGARVEVNPEKRNPTDFALWKFLKKDEKRQQEWDSPWGRGFPGWHIECSAMSRALLGSQLDIHTGGIEHIPIHHNNEIAQSESLTGKTFANYWLHNAHLQIEGHKIAKSTGNTVFLREIVEKGFSPLALRYLVLTAHYKSQMNFTWSSIEAANKALNKLYKYMVDNSTNNGVVDDGFRSKFVSFINDDLDTPKAIALVWELMKSEDVETQDKIATLLDFDEVFGLDFRGAMDRKLEIADQTKVAIKDAPKKVQELLRARKKARTNKDYAESDKLRDKIKELGFEIKDADGDQNLYLSTT